MADNKKKDKKIKFNLMDALICVVVVLVIAGGMYILKGRNTTGAATQNAKVSVTVELTGQTENIVNAIKVGDAVSIGEKEKAAAVVSNVEVTNAHTTGFDIETGKVLNSVVPDQYDVQVTMTADGLETDDYIAIDNVAMRVGEKMVVSAKGWAGQGYAVKLSTDNEG